MPSGPEGCEVEPSLVGGGLGTGDAGFGSGDGALALWASVAWALAEAT